MHAMCIIDSKGGGTSPADSVLAGSRFQQGWNYFSANQKSNAWLRVGLVYESWNTSKVWRLSQLQRIKTSFETLLCIHNTLISTRIFEQMRFSLFSILYFLELHCVPLHCVPRIVCHAHFKLKQLSLLPQYKSYNAFKMIDNNIIGC